MFLAKNRQDATANAQERQRVQTFFKQSLKNSPNKKKPPFLALFFDIKSEARRRGYIRATRLEYLAS